VAGRQRIDGVKVKPMRVIPDERGWLMEILRADEPELFSRFGQVSCRQPTGVVKGWHYHRKQVDNLPASPGW
jgi:dTDP-4-dehydrorhamnose 3,5-epimerase